MTQPVHDTALSCHNLLTTRPFEISWSTKATDPAKLCETCFSFLIPDKTVKPVTMTTRPQYTTYSLAQLQSMARERQLPVSGKKSMLIVRLMNDDLFV